MHLWNDYEGQTIAEAYPLEKLLRPEGRSAFFVTKNDAGARNVIRLTESLNDEHEMLERWRQVSQVHQENLVEIKSFGQTTFDGVPLAYALMESTDANLAEILAERPLTTAETTEVGISVTAALAALHESGLIHEHLEPANVLASGEVIKLRSDCVRECVGDPEFTSPATCQELKQRDVHDLGVLLLRCLTLERQWAPGTRLAAPFHLIVPRAIDGSWGLPEIAAALQPPAVLPVKPLVPEGVIPARPARSNEAGPQARVAQALSQGQERAQTVVPQQAGNTPQAAIPVTETAVPPVFAPVQESIAFPAPGPSLPVRRLEAVRSGERFSVPRSWLIGAGATILGLLLLWFLIPAKTSAPKTPSAPTADAIQTIDDAPAGPAVTAPTPAARTGTAAAVAAAGREAAGTGSGQAGWRVVCYTFTHEEQAWTRAGALRRTHNSLHPGVFAPTPRGPYLVTLGGAMSESEADAMLRRARRSGLPRDSFIRAYPRR